MEERFKGTGRVKWFNDVQGFGIIVDEQNGEEVYVHHTAMPQGMLGTLDEGQRVSFEAFQGSNGIQACAVRPA